MDFYPALVSIIINLNICNDPLVPPISTISLYPVDLGGFVNSYNMIEQVIIEFKNWTLIFEYQKLTKVGSSISLLESFSQKVDHTYLAWKVLSIQFEHHLFLEPLLVCSIFLWTYWDLQPTFWYICDHVIKTIYMQITEQNIDFQMI